jgi:hypothetical protein
LRRLILLTITSVFLISAANAAAVTLHEIGSFNQPIYVTSGPFNPDRLLVAEREGMVIEVTPSGRKPLADLTELVECCEGERGLLSIAPAPDFESSGRFYAAYTGNLAAGSEIGDVHVDAFRPGPGGSPIREQVLTVAHSAHDNHNGGQLQFGPDGHLYISLGDGGGTGDPAENAQNLESRLGKILRIDPKPGQAPSFTVPADNPFVGRAGLDEIWAYGLRNPWRFSFDRLTGDMVIGDVGQDTREEVDFAPSPGDGMVSGGGDNYGWNCREGFIAYTDPGAACATAGSFSEPVFDYPHEDPGNGAAYGCAILGGYVVRDPGLNELSGRYLYTDYCTGQIRSLVLPVTANGKATDDRAEVNVSKPTSFGEDSCGRVYITSDLGPVYRLEGPAPTICTHAEPVAVSFRKSTRSARVQLRARWVRGRVKLIASVSPCAEDAGGVLQLNRGGRRLKIKRLNQKCRALFRLRVNTRATFRALVFGDPGSESRRLSVKPPGHRPRR